MKAKDKKQIVANRIDNLCKEKGISYYSLAYKSTVPLTTLLHIVDGSTKNPGIFTIIKICDGLEMTLKDFFDTDDFLQVLKEDLD